MLTNLASSPRVRLDGSTTPQGLPSPAPSTAVAARPDSHALAPPLTLRRSTLNASPLTAYAAFVGLDWADRKPEVWLPPAGSDQREFRIRPPRPERMAPGAQGLRQRFEGRPIAVGLEQRTGPLVYARQPYDVLVLFAVTPTTLATSREAFCLSDAKDDPPEAELALERLMTHRDTLTALHPQGAARRALPRLVAQRRSLVADKVRRTNRLTAALKPYVPPVLEGFKDKDTLVFCDLLTRWPPLQQAQRARKARLTAFFHEHHGRSPHSLAQRLPAILSATPLTTASGVLRPTQVLVEGRVEQLRWGFEARERFDHESARRAPTRPD